MSSFQSSSSSQNDTQVIDKVLNSGLKEFNLKKQNNALQLFHFAHLISSNNEFASKLFHQQVIQQIFNLHSPAIILSKVEPRFIDADHGRGLFASETLFENETILIEKPLLCVAIKETEEQCNVCHHCMRFIGNLTEQFNKASKIFRSNNKLNSNDCNLKDALKSFEEKYQPYYADPLECPYCENDDYLSVIHLTESQLSNLRQFLHCAEATHILAARALAQCVNKYRSEQMQLFDSQLPFSILACEYYPNPLIDNSIKLDIINNYEKQIIDTNMKKEIQYIQKQDNHDFEKDLFEMDDEEQQMWNASNNSINDDDDCDIQEQEQNINKTNYEDDIFNIILIKQMNQQLAHVFGVISDQNSHISEQSIPKQDKQFSCPSSFFMSNRFQLTGNYDQQVDDLFQPPLSSFANNEFIHNFPHPSQLTFDNLLSIISRNATWIGIYNPIEIILTIIEQESNSKDIQISTRSSNHYLNDSTSQSVFTHQNESDCYSSIYNSFLPREQIPKAIGLGVFMLHSNCNHSCIPNSEAVVYKIPQTSEQLDNEQIEKEFSFSYQGQNLEILREGALLRLVTKRLDDQDQNTKNIVINKGEEITISYLSEDELLLPVSERRRLLLQDYGFECNCPRCQLETINIQKQ